MEQAFVLPLPKYSGPHSSEIVVEEELRRNGQMTIWRSILDKLSEKKISWQQIASYTPLYSADFLQHPLVCFATDQNGQSLLHLAVLQAQDEWVDFLGKAPSLRQKRNNFGLTPLELAQFLYHPSHIVSLGGSIFASRIHTFEQVYIPHPIFSSIEIFHEVLHHSKKAKLEDLIPTEKIWMGIYFDKEIQTRSNRRFSIRYIDEEVGFGVFAEQRISPCSFVGEYTGIIKERNKKEIKDKRYVLRYNCWQARGRKFVIDAETHGNHTRFINHSSQPNLVLQSVYWRGIPRMVFVSSKEIAEGAQLTFDYGKSFWKEMNQRPRLFT